jgi:sugar-specific transcriptional regulator TrmB
MEAKIIAAMRGRELTAAQIAHAVVLPFEEVYEVLVRLEARGRARLIAAYGSCNKPPSRTWGLVETRA